MTRLKAAATTAEIARVADARPICGTMRVLPCISGAAPVERAGLRAQDAATTSPILECKLDEQLRRVGAPNDDIGIDVRALEIAAIAASGIGQLAMGPAPSWLRLARHVVKPIFRGSGDRQAGAQVSSQKYPALRDCSFAA